MAERLLPVKGPLIETCLHAPSSAQPAALTRQKCLDALCHVAEALPEGLVCPIQQIGLRGQGGEGVPAASRAPLKGGGPCQVVALESADVLQGGHVGVGGAERRFDFGKVGVAREACAWSNRGEGVGWIIRGRE